MVNLSAGDMRFGCKIGIDDVAYYKLYNEKHLRFFLFSQINTQGSQSALKIRNTSTTTKTQVAYGNSHLACM